MLPQGGEHAVVDVDAVLGVHDDEESDHASCLQPCDVGSCVALGEVMGRG